MTSAAASSQTDDRCRSPGDGARVGTVLVDGEFRATWQLAARGDMVTLTVHATPELSPPQVDEVCQEGQLLLAFLAPDATAGDVVMVSR